MDTFCYIIYNINGYIYIQVQSLFNVHDRSPRTQLPYLEPCTHTQHLKNPTVRPDLYFAVLHNNSLESINLDNRISTNLLVEEKRNSHFSDQKDEYGADHMSEIHIVGRIVLNLWRIMRHEVL